MKKKSSTRRPTRTSMETSSARSKTSSAKKTKAVGRGRKKPQKQDNTKIFIGIGVGVFVFIMIVVAVSSGGNKAPRKTVSTTKTKEKYLLPLSVRKQIFAEYIEACPKISAEVEASVKLADDLTIEERRKQLRMIQSTIRSKEKSFQIEQAKKHRKKHPKATGNFVKRCIDEGLEKNWK